MGGQSTPTQPTAPTATQNMQDYISNYPALFNLQQQYAPQEAAQQVSIAQQYALPYGQAIKSAQDALYPQTSALQENLAGQATQGMNSQMPDWMKSQYQSNMNAQLGSNVNAPVGADYASRGLLQQQEDWKRYYQNLGLSVSGKQPLTQASSPSYTNQLQGYTANGVSGANAQNYSTAMSGYNSTLSNSNSSSWMNMLGTVAGAGLGGLAGGWAGKR